MTTKRTSDIFRERGGARVAFVSSDNWYLRHNLTTQWECTWEFPKLNFKVKAKKREAKVSMKEVRLLFRKKCNIWFVSCLDCARFHHGRTGYCLRVQVERLQHSDTMGTIKKIKRFVQNHPILFTVLGILYLVALSPFLLILAVMTIPLFLVFCSFMVFLIVSFSFVFGFLFNFAVVVFVGVASCYVIYRLIRLAISCIQACLNCITSCSSNIYQCSMRTLYELFSQLRDSSTGDIAQQRINMEECVDSNNSSDLEDIQPDYRDGRDKLHEALLTRPQYTGRDTFEPFQY